MASLLPNPLVKILFIIVNTYSAYKSNCPPRPPADKSEIKKYRERKDTSDSLTPVARITVPILMITIFSFAVCDIYTIVYAVYPALRVPLLHNLILPSPAVAPKVSNFYLSTPFVWGSVMLWMGTFIRWLCYRTLGRHFTFELSLQKEHRLVTEGPYSLVRHPSYLGYIFVAAGMVTTQLLSPGTWWVESSMWQTWQGKVFGTYWLGFSSYVTYMLLSRVPKEDLMLRIEFKEQWLSWSRKTKYAVIPFIW
ncbi:hypothetical protein EUX98_g6570 [Antrodiella citrinella]|uniref:Protein-S-isoprenylcysteine O-methyltransferase n=1 Tax=Antrodiella citrinella TaxID=2447956 RepID=A0A4S4MQG6_9APHY|nr:hypothetical protein EUX98_g6570 [Antrodiella citrinella]